VDRQQIESLIQQALAAISRGDDVRAVAITDQLATELPDDALVRATRAQALLSGADAEAAFDEARRAVELDAQNALAQLLLGLAAWRTERLGLAQQSLVEAVRLSGRSARYLTQYAWFMAQERGPRLAEAAAREAIAADASSSTAWAALGLAKHRLHNNVEAEASLRQALRLDPNDIYAQSAMVVLLQHQRHDEQAVALSKLLEESPGAEDFVAAVRAEAKRRHVERLLVEHKAMPGAPERRGWWLWLSWSIAAGMVGAGVCLVFQPSLPIVVLMCVIIPSLLLWGLRRAFD
jgi:Tfp pilus assembly protein PilF